MVDAGDRRGLASSRWPRIEHRRQGETSGRACVPRGCDRLLQMGWQTFAHGVRVGIRRARRFGCAALYLGTGEDARRKMDDEHLAGKISPREEGRGRLRRNGARRSISGEWLWLV